MGISCNQSNTLPIGLEICTAQIHVDSMENTYVMLLFKVFMEDNRWVDFIRNKMGFKFSNSVLELLIVQEGNFTQMVV